jgi:hypothetical protein
MLHVLSREAWYAALVGAILGGILSIPLQLGTGLLFPSVQRWFDARAKQRAFAKSAKTRKQYEEAYYFVTYPHKMTHYFLNRGLELFRLSILAIIGWGGFLWSPIKIAPGILGSVSWLIGFGGLFFLLVIIFQSVNDLHAIYYRVEFWGDYKKKVALELPDVVAQTERITSSSE